MGEIYYIIKRKELKLKITKPIVGLDLVERR